MYFGIRQADKSSRADYVYFHIYKFIRFCYFYVAHNIKNFIVKFCMLVGYIINYFYSYFHNFLTLNNMIFMSKS
jgi:hypothetical protein